MSYQKQITDGFIKQQREIDAEYGLPFNPYHYRGRIDAEYGLSYRNNGFRARALAIAEKDAQTISIKRGRHIPAKLITTDVQGRKMVWGPRIIGGKFEWWPLFGNKGYSNDGHPHALPKL